MPSIGSDSSLATVLSRLKESNETTNEELADLIRAALGAPAASIYQWRAGQHPYIEWVTISSQTGDIETAQASFLSEYYDIFAGGDLSYHAIRPLPAELDTAEVVIGSYYGEEAASQTRMYRHLLSHLEVFYLLRAVVNVGGDRFAWIGAFRQRDAGNFGVEDQAKLQALLPLLTERLRASWPLGPESSRAGLLNALLDAVHEPAFILALDGRLIHANQAAALRLNEDSTLRKTLAEAAHAVASQDRVVHGPPGIVVSRCDADSAGYVLAVCREKLVSSSSIKSALSPREHQVAALVAEGYSTLNIASNLGIGEETVRTLLKRVFRKWGVANRVELTRAYFSRSVQ